MIHEDFKRLYYSYSEEERPWAFEAFDTKYLEGSDWFNLFREFLERQFPPHSDSFFPLEYRVLHRSVFGSLDEAPLLINSQVPGIADIASWRLFHSV